MEDKEIKAREIVAATLYDLVVDNSSLETWRSDPVLRERHRKLAAVFVSELKRMGVSFRVSSSKKLDEAVESLVTVPAAPAYSVIEDSAEVDDPGPPGD